MGSGPDRERRPPCAPVRGAVACAVALAAALLAPSGAAGATGRDASDAPSLDVRFHTDRGGPSPQFSASERFAQAQGTLCRVDGERDGSGPTAGDGAAERRAAGECFVPPQPIGTTCYCGEATGTIAE